MAGNTNWWNINNIRPPIHQQMSPFLSPPLFPHYTSSSPASSSSSSSSFLSSSSSSSSSSSLTIPFWHDNQDQLPESWSQLMDGLVDEDNKGNMRHFQAKKLENWEEQMIHHQASSACNVVDVKQENSTTSYVYGHANEGSRTVKPSWSQMIPPASSPMSRISSKMLDFSTNKGDAKHPPPDLSSECNNTETGGALKKARVQPSSIQSTFKTDTASVLLEAIEYIRFLQSQVEALSLPYLGSGSSNMRRQQQQEYVQGERNCIFPEDPGQVGSDNGADYWAPAVGDGFR